MKTIKSKVSLYELLRGTPQVDLINIIDDAIYEYARKVAEENNMNFNMCAFAQSIKVKINIWEDDEIEVL